MTSTILRGLAMLCVAIVSPISLVIISLLRILQIKVVVVTQEYVG